MNGPLPDRLTGPNIDHPEFDFLAPDEQTTVRDHGVAGKITHVDDLEPDLLHDDPIPFPLGFDGMLFQEALELILAVRPFELTSELPGTDRDVAPAGAISLEFRLYSSLSKVNDSLSSFSILSVTSLGIENRLVLQFVPLLAVVVHPAD